MSGQHELPYECYSVLPSSGELISLHRGENGYYPCDSSKSDPEENRLFADTSNKIFGVTRAQEEAMLAGSLFGWDTPAAKPWNYDADGKLRIIPMNKKETENGGSVKMAGYDAMKENFEEVTIFDKPALFTPGRIDNNTVPKGYYLYEVRHDDDCQGDAVQIAKRILVNHWGTLVTRDKIKLPPDGYLDIELEDLNYGAGECKNIKDFMEKYPPVKQPKKQER